ncbi:zinc-ribbon domain-containing protein [Maritalea sp.]|uniref:zinc-ribbon domain-containing protein n=1 Tax=Maritalea sp. TaxID=2003361 RepID=UPI003EF59879
MIIVCPNCSTRYEVAAQAIGDRGRSVQCATCQQSWHAKEHIEKDLVAQVDDALEDAAETDSNADYEPADEDALDVAFNAEEDNAQSEQFAAPDPTDQMSSEIDLVAEPPGANEVPPQKGDAGSDAVESARDAAQIVINSINDDDEVELQSYAGRRRQQIERMKRSRRIAKRKREIARALPMAKLRRNVSYGALGATVVVLGVVLGFRDKLVQNYPDLAGFYRLFGQSVNVVGLEFANVKTDRLWRDGHEVLSVRADIANITGRMIYLPPIRVVLLGEEGEIIYEWNTTPSLAVLESTGVFEFKTELSSPPNDVKRVKMKFLEWHVKPRLMEKSNADNLQMSSAKPRQRQSVYAGTNVAAERLKAFNK